MFFKETRCTHCRGHESRGCVHKAFSAQYRFLLALLELCHLKLESHCLADFFPGHCALTLLIKGRAVQDVDLL